jgi:two-component system OmpR family response regulator
VKILLVEDDKQIAEYVAKGLREKGHVVDRADNGRDGLYLATGEYYEVMIVDRMLPHMDGLSLVKAARSAGVNTPALFLTTMGGVDDRVAGLEGGADDYLVKPFALDELLARLRAFERRAPTAGQGRGELRFADLVVDRDAMTCRRGSREIQLSRTEYQLLELLLANQGKVLSRDVIFDKVWGYDFGPESNSLDVYVGYLRRKLEADGEPRIIHTVRGVGYVMREA